ncbi:CD177 antigen [Ctenodactylus gundi]
MSPAPLLAFLGVTFLLPGVQTLTCHGGKRAILGNVTEMPIQLITEQKTCEAGEGCQETVILIENGPQVVLLFTKGCSSAKDQQVKVTEHRTGPGLAITSYTQVCRRELCNDLSTSTPLWAPPHTGDLHMDLIVQGCMPQPGCSLLNGTQNIGHLSTSEDCSPRPKPREWTANRIQKCEEGEVCQETLLLIDTGPKTLLLGSKGCGRSSKLDSPTVSIHSHPPGVLVASYSHFCSSNLCNNAGNSSILLTSLPQPGTPGLGDLQCGACVQIGGSCSERTICPKNTTHCYEGNIDVRGVVAASVGRKGCFRNDGGDEKTAVPSVPCNAHDFTCSTRLSLTGY